MFKASTSASQDTDSTETTQQTMPEPPKDKDGNPMAPPKDKDGNPMRPPEEQTDSAAQTDTSADSAAK